MTTTLQAPATGALAELPAMTHISAQVRSPADLLPEAFDDSARVRFGLGFIAADGVLLTARAFGAPDHPMCWHASAFPKWAREHELPGQVVAGTPAHRAAVVKALTPKANALRFRRIPFVVESLEAAELANTTLVTWRPYVAATPAGERVVAFFPDVKVQAAGDPELLDQSAVGNGFAAWCTDGLVAVASATKRPMGVLVPLFVQAMADATGLPVTLRGIGMPQPVTCAPSATFTRPVPPGQTPHEAAVARRGVQ